MIWPRGPCGLEALTSMHEAGTVTVEQEFLGRFQRL